MFWGKEDQGCYKRLVSWGIKEKGVLVLGVILIYFLPEEGARVTSWVSTTKHSFTKVVGKRKVRSPSSTQGGLSLKEGNDTNSREG